MGLGDGEIDAREYGRSPAAVVRFDAIGEAWGLVTQRWGTWALTVIVVIVAYGLVSGLVASIFGIKSLNSFGMFRWRMPPGGSMVHGVLSGLVTGFFVGGMFRMACRQVRGQRFGVEDLFSVFDVLGELMLGSVLYAAALMVATLICFVIPGLLVNGLLMFTFPLIVDRRMPAPAAMAMSWNTLKSQWLMATLFHLVVVFLSGLGVVLCGVGLLLSAPLYVMAIAVLYRDFFLRTGPTKTGPKPAPPYSDF